jgi:hypothetical protein
MSAEFVPIYVHGDTGLHDLAHILKANGFALRCDIEGRTIAEPISPGIFNMVRREPAPQ